MSEVTSSTLIRVKDTKDALRAAGEKTVFGFQHDSFNLVVEKLAELIYP